MIFGHKGKRDYKKNNTMTNKQLEPKLLLGCKSVLLS